MYRATEFINPTMLIAVGGGEFTVQFQSPVDRDYLGLPPAGTALTNDGQPFNGPGVLSIHDGTGEVQIRPLGTAGGYERCRKSGNFLIFSGAGRRRFAVPFAE